MPPRDPAKPPSRSLTPTQRRFVKRHGRHLQLIWPPFLIAALFTGIGAIGTFDLPGPEGLATMKVFFWIGLGVFAFAAGFNWLWHKLTSGTHGVFADRDLAAALAQGTVMKATVAAVLVNSAYRQGEIPWSVVVVELPGGAQASFGAFLATGFGGLCRGDVIEVIHTPTIPALAIPADLLRD